MGRLQGYRDSFANFIASQTGIAPESELARAFASTPREQFVGPPPWTIFPSEGSVEAPSDDPVVLYRDVVVSLGADGPLNNGQPTLHAHCIATLGIHKGDRVVHVGAGTGYYTTILAKLVGETGSVDAYEIDPDLAERATDNLAEFSRVTVHPRSGATTPIPQCDVLYVNAGATRPLPVWLDSLCPNGRLLLPLTPDEGFGGMLLVKRKEDGTYPANFLCQVKFVPCAGARSPTEAQSLVRAFQHGNWSKAKFLHRNDAPDVTCWVSGDGWWLSTR